MDKRKITYFEIFLIVSLSISFSWIVGDVYGTAPKIENVLEFISLVPSVSAQATECCVNTNYGASCIDLPSGDCDNSCDGECVPTSCQSVSQCGLGCGFDKSEGTCNPNIPKTACENNENCEFLNDPFCNVPQCQQGCCVVGLNNYWGTQSECTIRGERVGISPEFDSSIESEQACFRESQNLEEGACVFNLGDEKNSCVFTNQLNCDDNIGGDFYKGYLCSNTELGTNCKKQDSANCVEGKDEVYWYDSCGNKENIYSSDKTRSWNNGKVLAKDKSCNPNSDNSGSGSCGNCNYNLGSVCGEFNPGVDKGNMEGFTCKDLNCVDSEGKSRINGESWCVYDGPVGSGGIGGNSGGPDISSLLGIVGGGLGGIGSVSRDLMGSRHFRQICSNGEVQVEPCADYRKEICVQNDKTLDNGKKVDSAICRVNLWEQCFAANEGIGQQLGGGVLGDLAGMFNQKCNQNPDCRTQTVNVDKNFKFSLCVPKYPPGFELGQTTGLAGFGGNIGSSILGDVGGGIGDLASGLGGNSEGSSASDICGLGTQTCTSTWVKTCTPPKWECKENCDCHEAGFTMQLNNLCVSLGDCGLTPNIEGKVGFGGAKVSKKGSKGKTPPQPFLFAPLYMIFSKLPPGPAPDGGFYNEEQGIFELPGHGLLDPFLSGLSGYGGGGGFEQGPGGITGTIGPIGEAAAIGGVAGVGGTLLGTTTSVVSGVTVTTSAGLFGSTATLGSVGGVGGGTTIAGGWGGAALNPLTWNPVTFVIVAVVVYVILDQLGCGEVKKVEIKYDCKPAQVPFGGNDCKKCDDDPLKPCSTYRCQSLGARCKFINEGTGVSECITIEGEGSIPIITPWEEILNTTFYSYQDVSTNGFRVRTADNECVPAFSPIVFGVETDIHSVCGWSLERGSNITEMNSFIEGNVFTYNHTFMTVLPSAESLLAGEVSNFEELQAALATQLEEEGISIEEYLLNKAGDLNIYIKCSNMDGVANDVDYKVNFCVDPGPDEQLPVVTATAPPPKKIVAFNAEEQNAVFFVSEPAECKWSSVKPTKTGLEAYNNLENEMDCELDAENVNLLGYACTTTLPILEKENDYYIMCQDQPWLAEDPDGERNVGNVFPYSLLRSESALTISSIKPSGITYAGSEPVIVNLEVETSGGMADGISACAYDFDGENPYSLFLETGGKKHKQILSQMKAGDYEIFIRCADDALNIAEGIANFTLELDTKPPIVTRVFGSGGNIILTTDEPARCFYKNDSNPSCGFSTENAIEFGGANTKTLSAPIGQDITHYIQCQDVWGNRPDMCSIIVKEFKDG